MDDSREKGALVGEEDLGLHTDGERYPLARLFRLVSDFFFFFSFCLQVRMVTTGLTADCSSG